MTLFSTTTRWIFPFILWSTATPLLLPAQDLPAELSLENKLLLLEVNPRDGTLSVHDKRNGKTWNQQATSRDVSFTSGAVSPVDRLTIHLKGVTGENKTPIKCDLTLDSDLPEFTVLLTGEGDLPGALSFPQPFVGGQDLIIPLNEGIRYPVEDPTIPDRSLVTYGGHGISMPFWGVTDGEASQMAICETPDDGRIKIARQGKSLCVEPQWDAQMGKFGYARRLRYIFSDHGGYVAMCKRYRSYAQKTGLFKTLEDKRKDRPQLDLLIGAANIWYFANEDEIPMAKEMLDAGMKRMLWSNALAPGVDQLNKLGLLTGCYDLYQDIMNPAEYPKLAFIHHDWIPQAWPSQLILDARGKPIPGWKVRGHDGTLYPCNVLSDRFAPGYAQARITADLAKNPYGARFIDTTTAAPWREDYSPAHPQTRTECRRWRMDLLDLVSNRFRLVTGTETGLDAAVPYVDYFEGMLSLGPYRLPDSGNDMEKIWTAPPPEDLVKFQTGAYYRLPLWELVYHDCVVAGWYWGDYNNKIPSLWDKRDLFNVLYGTVPMFMFDRAFWKEHKDRFLQSYRNTCPLARSVGYSEMVEHRYLTPDAMVQQTRFANGVIVTVNFGTTKYASGANETIAPGGFSVIGLKDESTSRP